MVMMSAHLLAIAGSTTHYIVIEKKKTDFLRNFLVAVTSGFRLDERTFQTNTVVKKRRNSTKPSSVQALLPVHLAVYFCSIIEYTSVANEFIPWLTAVLCLQPNRECIHIRIGWEDCKILKIEKKKNAVENHLEWKQKSRSSKHTLLFSFFFLFIKKKRSKWYDFIKPVLQFKLKRHFQSFLLVRKHKYCAVIALFIIFFSIAINVTLTLLISDVTYIFAYPKLSQSGTAATFPEAQQ